MFNAEDKEFWKTVDLKALVNWRIRNKKTNETYELWSNIYCIESEQVMKNENENIVCDILYFYKISFGTSLSTQNSLF